jgi:hypothetical protein
VLAAKQGPIFEGICQIAIARLGVDGHAKRSSRGTAFGVADVATSPPAA